MKMNQKLEGETAFLHHWFFRYKLYHLPFWFVYHTLWWVITIGSITEVVNNIFNSAYAVKFLFYVVFQALGVYFNLYFLLPRLLHRRMYVRYILFLTITIIGTASCIVSGYYLSAYWSGIPFQQLFYHDPSDFMFFFSINALPSTAASMTLAMSVKLTKNWIESERKQQLLEKEKLETELKYLKSQFNPHFLFNTINSIFVLIHKNPDLASESLANFSDLLRYQLYECNEDEIDLDKEIRFIDDFMQLEKLRIDEQQTDLQFETTKNTTQKLLIAPFLLIPFIENAFKHVSKGKGQKNHIHLYLEVVENQLCIQIANSITLGSRLAKDVSGNSGIGLKNVRRRLDLLYSNRYELKIEETENTYQVRLDLQLNENKSSV